MGTRKHRKKFGAPLLAGPFLNYGSIHFLLWHFAFKRNLSSRETLRERACVCASTTPVGAVRPFQKSHRDSRSSGFRPCLKLDLFRIAW